MPVISQRSRVVASAFMIQGIVIGLMFGYGVIFKVLEDDLGWSRTVLSGASSLAFLTMGLLAYFCGRLSDRYGPRWVLTVSGILTGLAYVLMGTMQYPWQLWLFMGFLAGVGLATHDVVTLSTVATWYQRKRGLMTGVVKTGTALGQVLFPLLVTALVAVFGWRHSLFILGTGGAILLVALAQSVRRNPETTSAVAANDSSPNTQMSLAEAKRSRILWTLCAIQFCFFPSMVTVPLHIVAHATDLGMTTLTAATVLSLIGGCSIAGRLSVGFLHDKLGGRRAMLMCLCLLTLALLALRIIDSPSLLFILAPFYGIAHGGLFTVVSPTVAEYFGLKAHGAIFGIIVFFGTLSGASGPLLAGMVFDRAGSYSIAFSTLLILASIGFCLALSLPRKT